MGFALMILPEETGQFSLGNPDTGVFDPGFYISVNLFAANRDLAAGPGELNGIAQQIPENLNEPARVGAELRQSLIAIITQLDVLFFRNRK